MAFIVRCVIFLVISACHLSQGQLPQRLNIPGAVLLSQSRPAPFRQQRIQPEHIPQRLRRPSNPNAIQAPIRPVIEETEESVTTTSGSFDDEVTKLGISALQNAVRQNGNFEDDALLKPVQFRPERPLPVLRQNVREGGPAQKPLPAFRQEQKENYPKPLLRQEYRDDIPVPVRQPVRQQRPVQPTAQPVRQSPRTSAPRQQYLDDETRSSKPRKPVVQILRKYRTDNADGSITWGFENDDGTFKEETLGIDCVTRGKYGYVDPDGVRRDYSYETGNKCDQPEEEEEPILQPRPQQIQSQSKKPIYRPSGGQI